MRGHVLRWTGALRRAFRRHCETLASVPDPHGQFPALPIEWYRNDDVLSGVVIPEQPSGAPAWHPDRRR
jgi:hypothetical protein